MLKRVATLLLAMTICAGAMAHAGEKGASASKKCPLSGQCPLMGKDRPASMDRHLAPDAYPTNVVKILRTTNKAQTNSYVPVVFTMRNNNPFSVIRMLHKPVQEEEGLLFTYVSPEGNGGKVVYCVPKYMIPSLEALVKSLDLPGLTTAAGDKRIYRQLKHRRADSSDSAFLDVAASYTTGDGATVINDPETNALYWCDAPSGSLNLDSVLTDKLDVPTAMVQLMVKVYEMNSNNDATIGQDYLAWKNSLGQDLFAVGAFDEYAQWDNQGPNYGDERHIAANGYNGAYNYQMSSAFFDYLQSKGKARILDQAKLAALNNKTAVLSAGDQVLYYSVNTTSDPSGVRNTGNLFQANGTRTVNATTQQADSDGNLTPVETGLTVAFRPIIGDKTVNLNMLMAWSDYNGFDGKGFPQINPRVVSTTLRLGVGEETVIGGLKRHEEVKDSQKAPFLGSLPVLGYMFGQEKVTNKDTEVLIAVKPMGIMEYKLAGGSMVDADDQKTIDKVTNDASANTPDTKWGFDMYGVDFDMKAKLEAAK